MFERILVNFHAVECSSPSRTVIHIFTASYSLNKHGSESSEIQKASSEYSKRKSSRVGGTVILTLRP